MSAADVSDPGYPEPGKLEMIWGDGYMSPGGPAEVARILGGADIAGCAVLDIGSGMGGADLALVANHGAGSVIGIDVQHELVEAAGRRAERSGLAGRIGYRLYAPGHLPFVDASFDVVFSKDAIIHVHDKRGLYAEMLRVLRPGGRLMIGDWLRGAGEQLDSLVQDFVAASGHDFALVSLEELGAIAWAAGFVDIALEDRRDWYMAESRTELERLRGPLGAGFRRRWGNKAADDEIAFWTTLVSTVAAGALRPGHIRAAKPVR